MIYRIPKDMTLLVKEGDLVAPGTKLTEGHVDLRELLKATGREEVERYILREVQRVYVTQGATINNKHIEIVLRQMFSKVRIKDVGESGFIPGEIVDRSRLIEENQALVKARKKPAKGQELLLGITKAALRSSSFLAAASFQETSRVLVEASSEGREDRLRGLKENVVIGKLIPAGTGLKKRQSE